MSEPKKYVRGVDDIPAGIYSQNPDGTYSPAVPIGWQEEHNWLGRFLLWVRGIEHCNDRAGQKTSRFQMRQAMDDIHRSEDPND